MTEPESAKPEPVKCAGCEKVFKYGDTVYLVTLDNESSTACKACVKKEGKIKRVAIFRRTDLPGESSVTRDRAARKQKKLDRHEKKGRKKVAGLMEEVKNLERHEAKADTAVKSS
jgi:hypothetical protein